MTPGQQRNLSRLLSPRHVAVIGGDEAEAVAGECKRIGFSGRLWPVNPRRSQIAGQDCFVRNEDLPEAPDAVFLAIPPGPAVEAVARLNAQGAGGVVCYTAGFGELDGGQALQQELVDAAGDVALVGPNCYGVINYIDRVALWPFVQGGWCPGYGAAVVTQSGMLSSDLTMSQRSVPLAYMISAGNQAMLGLEDYVHGLADNRSVRAIGLHIEGLKNIESFVQAAERAMDRNIPIVALKTGSSKIGARLTVSHTGSLSGDDDLYQALFERLGIIRVYSPAAMLEALKLLCVAGAPRDNRLLGLTCSGGGATLLADHADGLGLSFPPPAPATAKSLKTLLPPIAAVSNPLDYTPPIWGDTEKLPPVFEAAMADSYAAAILIQDYPLPELSAGRQYYLNDAISFARTARAAGVPAIVCSILPENIDLDTRELLIENGVVPMQGIRETLEAIRGAICHSEQRRKILAGKASRWTASHVLETPEDLWRPIDEWQGKQHLMRAGLSVPESRLATSKEAPACADSLGYPVVVKMISEKIAHKTDAGAVVLGLNDRYEVETAVRAIQSRVARHLPDAVSDAFLVERQVGTPVGELLVGIRNDAQFGLIMTLASGGVFTELIGDATTSLLPTTRAEMEGSLSRLKLSSLLDGFRGRSAVDRGSVIDALQKLTVYMQAQAAVIGEIEINPLFVMEDNVYAVDVLVRVASPSGS